MKAWLSNELVLLSDISDKRSHMGWLTSLQVDFCATHIVIFLTV